MVSSLTPRSRAPSRSPAAEPGFRPQVRLLVEDSARRPSALTVAAAWTCYAARPAEVGNAAALFSSYQAGQEDAALEPEFLARRERAAQLYRSLFQAGHHTTFQHATFVFVLDGVSRLALWSFFHAHPFYNSEQVSQRYREVSGRTMVTPPLEGEALEVYRRAVGRALAGYRRLVALLAPALAQRYALVFPARARSRDAALQRKVQADVQKRAQEVARYVLPLATPAHLYHTINALTLLRYYALAGQPDAPEEVRAVVQAMVQAVLEQDPGFLGAPGRPLDLEPLAEEATLERLALAELRRAIDGAPSNEGFFAEFDAELQGRSSVLVDCTRNGDHVLAEAVRCVLGKTAAELPDEQAVAQVLDPRHNPYLGHPLYLAMQSKLMQALYHVQFTFKKRISGAEDAQNQRHRGTPGSRPVLLAHLRQQPDVIVPAAVREVPAALDEYWATITALWEAKNRLLDLGVKPEYVLYLLPNAHHVRLYESGPLLFYLWKWIKRLCYNAQREIFDSACDEVAQVAAALPLIGRYIARPPCVLRAEAATRPYCPEGERYCGVPVWRDYRFETLAPRRVL